MAAGTIYLGGDLKGKELWISSEDGRQHATIPERPAPARQWRS